MTSRLVAVLLASACASGPGSGGEPVAPAAPSPGQPSAPPDLEAPDAPVAPPVVPAEVVTAPPEPSAPPSLRLPPDEYRRQRPGAVWPPPGYVPPPCEVELSTKVARRGKAYEVTALARNRSSKAVTLSLPSRCPQGPVVFQGLGDGYDYYQSCAQGACAGPREPEKFTLAPGATAELAAVEVDPRGANCTQPLPAGRHTVSFTVSFQGQVCASTFGTIEGSAPAKPRGEKPPPRAPCPPMPACGIACPGGEFARDANGCTTCGCVDRRGVAPP